MDMVAACLKVSEAIGNSVVTSASKRSYSSDSNGYESHLQYFDIVFVIHL